MAEDQRVKDAILAYPIKRTSNYCVKAIFLFARTIIQLQNQLGVHLATKIKPTEKPPKISRALKIALKGIVKMLRRVNLSTTSATKIIKKINGLLTVPLLHFEGGKKLVRKFPLGEATIQLSLAVGSLIDALKFATTDILRSFASVTTSLMLIRYGEEVALINNDFMKASGHMLHILWNVIQILDPLSLPLDDVLGFEDCYDKTGIEDLKHAIDDAIGIDWPKPIPQMNDIASWEAVAICEKKGAPS